MKLTLILVLIAVLFFIFEDISKALSLIFEYKYIHVIPFMIGISAFIALKLSNLKSIIFKWLEQVFSYVMLCLLVVFLIFFVNAFFWEKVSSLDFLICVGVLCIGFFTGLLLDRIFTPCIEKIRRLFTKSAGTQRDSKTDIRDVQNSLESVLKYDPQTFFHPEKWFFGLDSKGSPIYSCFISSVGK